MRARETTARLADEFKPLLADMGYELVDIEWLGGARGRTLRVFIDKESGIGLDDCAAASETLSGRLDELDIIHVDYSLEVSSPGLERPLKKPTDFKRFIGRRIAVKTNKPAAGGRRKFKGVLKNASDTGFTLEIESGEAAFEYSEVKKAHLLIDL